MKKSVDKTKETCYNIINKIVLYNNMYKIRQFKDNFQGTVALLMKTVKNGHQRCALLGLYGSMVIKEVQKLSGYK